MVLALAGALLSILHQGYAFGINNHVYYIPPALHLPELPQFANEPFYATLKHYTTFVWPALGTIANDGNIESVVLIAHVISRFVEFVAMLYVLSLLGVRRNGLITAAVLIAAAPLFKGYSLIGLHGLFVNYFTHTELTTPLILAALALAWRNRIGAAYAVTGFTFNINAFVAIWLGAALLCGWVIPRWSLYRSQTTTALKDLAKSGICFIVPALPTAIWVAHVVLGAPNVHLDFVQYLREYYPYHFLIDSAVLWNAGQLVCAVAITIVVLVRGGFDRFWLYAYAGFAALFALGAVLPYVTGYRLLLDLHLLRVDGVLELLSILVLLTFALRGVPADAHLGDISIDKLAALACLATGQWYLIAFAFLLAIVPNLPKGRLWPAAAAVVVTALIVRGGPLTPREWYSIYLLVPVVALAFTRQRVLARRLVRSSLAVVIAAVLLPPAIYIGLRNFDATLQAREFTAWLDLARWIRTHPRSGDYMTPPDSPEENWDLQLWSRVPVWVSWKRGAAVQWWPQYYFTWHERYAQLRQAHTPEALYRLACRNGVPNLIVPGNRTYAWASAAVAYQNSDFQLYRINLPCKAE